MSIQAAWRFIHQVRQDEELRNAIQSLGQQADLERLVQIGAEAQLAFTAHDLQAAFKHDWTMRWIRYGSSDASK